MNAEERIAEAAEARLGTFVKRAEQALMAEKAQALRPFGLSVAQYAVLHALSLEPGLSGAQLARASCVTPQSMASLLSTLEAKGLIERHPSATHAQTLVTRLSPQGADLLRAADAAALSVERRLTAAFTPEEERVLRALLQRGTEALGGGR
ncbi:MarR family winged helix-turn-helix transcriptional regulator [Nocardiopsis trehalosi]|jgi:DNA-binding MarR family transcriptional regulator|uniref:MarR family winged helix-turn-helix transcriptional regulator n=1 Tax=Nocardiopsis trehalosi TaxID=109329 RepID=UPI00082E7F48|nr:MarR family winged helix-turn-helix transcriptional regulator [Nocardiopsis trehalosi]